SDASFGAPRGQAEYHHDTLPLADAAVAALVREVLHGRGIGASMQGPVSTPMGGPATTLVSQVQISAPETWVLGVGLWEHPDATMQLLLQIAGTSTPARCLAAPTAQVCAAAVDSSHLGVWQASLSGGRGGDAEPGLVRLYASGTGTVGGVRV